MPTPNPASSTATTSSASAARDSQTCYPCWPEAPVVERLGRDPVAFLPKPFTSVELVEKIRQVLDAPWNGVPNGRRPDG